MVSSTRLKAYLVLLGVFALGVVVGGGFFFSYAERRHAGLLEDDRREVIEGRRLRALSRRLGLSHDQEERIAAIVAGQQQIGANLANEMFERCGEPLRRHRTDIDNQIRAVLTPDQQQRYTELMGRRHRRFLVGPDALPLPPPPP